MIRIPPIVTMFILYGGQRAGVSAEKPGNHHVISRHVLFKSKEIRTQKWLLFSPFLPWNAVALVKGQDGNLGLKSQEGACRHSPEV